MTAPHDSTPADPRVEVAREYAHADPPGRHPHLTGILLMCLGLVLINTSDAIGKLMTEELPIFEIVLFQSVGLILLAMAVARRANPLTLVATPDPWLQGLRALFQTASGLCFFAGLKVLPFADLVAILFIGPLVVSAMAHVVLGEHVGPRRWAACLVGLAGALVIVRPGMDGLGWAAIWPVGAVVFWSAYIILTRRISARNSTASMMVWAALASFVLMAAASPWYWQTPQGWQWVALIAIALMSAASNGVTIRAFSIAPASLLAPFSYLEIVGATAFGFFIWHHFPDGWTWAGTAIIVASGLYVYRREAQAARS
ncbi:MAG: DMT family transporter [Proteobacteria bacterium]|nr:DMT family transporter [Pseudomonadota bacterium]MDA0951692.1 DMT family transporter [Pseudomonadota bacterium]MDA1070856.1 DMT family transporter [Pseudomonadota bacterium]